MKTLFILLFLFSSLFANEKLEKLTLQLHWTYQFEFAGFIAAKEKGFYKDIGVDLTILEKKGNKDLVDGLLNKDYDLLVTSSRFLLHKKAKKSLKFLANYFKQSPLAIVAQKENLSLYSLINKKIMISKNSLEKESIAMMFDKFKIDTKKLNVVKPTYNIEDFISKKIDAMLIFTTNELYELNKRNINYNIFYPLNYGLNSPDINLVSSNDLFYNNKDLIRKFLDATKKGWQYALDNPKEISKIIYNKYSKNKSMDALLYEAEKTKELILSDIYALGSIDYNYYKSYFDYLKNNKKINYDVSKIFYSSKKLELTSSEEKFLEKTKKVFLYYDKKNEPFYFFNKKLNRYDGLLYDYVQEIKKSTKLEFVIEKKNVINKYQKLNLISLPIISILHDGIENVNVSSNIKFRSIITDNLMIFNGLQSVYKNINIEYEENFSQAMQKLEDKKREIFLSNLISSKYWFKKNAYLNYQVVHNDNYYLPYFVNVDKNVNKSGLSVLKKAINKISEDKKNELNLKWTLANQKAAFDYSLVIKIFIFIIFIIFAIIIWNINLKKKVKEKTFEINELLKTLEFKVETRTKKLNEVKSELEIVLEKKISAIKYASLIQQSIIPNLKDFFKKSFVIWKPQDVVGGDIYSCNVLRNEDEVLLLLIDCTGHSVPGALVTMLVKAIEREIVARIINSQEEVSTSKILIEFDLILKELLKTEMKKNSIKVGFDGGVLYYNKKENYIKYSGAKTPLYYIQNDEFFKLKSNRCSIGYITSKLKNDFIEYKVDINTKTHLYLTTDGYIDQNGGLLDFPFGRKNFENLVFRNYKKDFSLQKDILINKLETYKEDKNYNDDIAVIGLELNENK